MAISKSNRKIMIYSALVLVLLFVFALFRDMSEPISLKEAKRLITQNQIVKAVMAEDTVYLYTAKERYRIPSLLLGAADLEGVVIDTNAGSNFFNKWFLIFSSIVILFALYYLYIKKVKNEMPVQKRGALQEEEFASSVVASSSNILFRDVAGIEDVKQELMELIGFLKDPNRYSRFGVRMPRGLLLVGPP